MMMQFDPECPNDWNEHQDIEIFCFPGRLLATMVRELLENWREFTFAPDGLESKCQRTTVNGKVTGEKCIIILPT